MKTICYEDLNFIDLEPWKTGSLTKNKRCIYDGKLYVCKSFDDPNYLKGKKMKLDLLSEIELKSILTPKFWVKKDDEISRYLTLYDEKDEIDAITSKPNNIIYNCLQNSKNTILLMHENGIIHSDLHPGNILASEYENSIIDFDNCTYKNFKTFKKDGSDYCIEFLKKYNLTSEIDIFMFNLLTYYIMNYDLLKDYESNNILLYHNVRTKIHQGKYGFFDNKEGIRICKSLFLDDRIPNKDFLIDTIDETSFSV